MSKDTGTTFVPRSRRAALILAACTVALGLLALLGWASNTPVLYRVLPTLPPMVPITALTFVLAGSALALLALIFRAGARLLPGLHLLALVLSATTTVIAVLVLEAYISGQRFVFADLLFPQAVARLGTPFGGTPSPSTALNFLFISLALLLLGSGRRALATSSEALAILALFLSIRTLIGYILGAPEFYVVIGETGMSLMTSLLFLALSFGILLLSTTGTLGLLRRATTTGMLFRRLIIGMVALLIVGLLLQLLNSRANLFGIGIVVVFLVSASVGLISWITQSLEKAERGRELAEQAQRANAARLAVMASASQTFAAAENDYQGLLNHITRTIVTELGDGCSILQLSADGRRLESITRYDRDPEQQSFLQTLGGGVTVDVDSENPSAQVFRSGHPLLLPVVDIAQLKTTLPPEYSAVFDRFKPCSLVVVPLRVRGSTVGVLNLYRCRPEASAFDEGDMLLVQDLAARAALAIENAQLLSNEQQQRQLAERVAAGLERLHAVSAALSGALSVAEVASVIMTQGVNALGADAGLVALLDGAADELQIIDARGYDARVLETQPRIPLSQPSALTEALRTSAPLWISSLAQQTREYPNLLVLSLSAEFQARAALPLLSSERKIGVLQINFRKGRIFESAERTLLEALASAGAQALDRARTYDALQQSLQRLQALRTIDQAMLGGQSAEDIIGRALDDLHALVPYAYGTVLLFVDAAQPQIVVEREWRVSAHGEAAEPLELAKAVEKLYEPSLRYVPAFAEALPPSPAREYLANQGLQGLLTLPLYADGIRLGQLNLFTGQATALLDEEQQIVTEIGGQIAIVLRHMQMLNARERAEERFRLVVEASPSGLIMTDLDGIIVLVNSQTEHMFGYLPHELIGESIDMLVPPRLRTNHAHFRKDFGLHPETRPMGAGRDLYGLCKDSSEFPIEIGLTPIHTSQGLHILSTIEDITERKQAENALRESQQKLSTLVDLLPVGISILNSQRQVVYTNLALEHIIDLPNGLIGEEAFRQRSYIHPDGTPMQSTDFASSQALNEQRAIYGVETGIVKEDGAITWVSVNAAPVDLPDWRVVIVTSDITERKRSEAALRESEERFAKAFHASPAAMLITHQSDGTFIDVNESYEELVGYRRDELIGKTGIGLDLYVSTGQRAEIVDMIRASGSLSDHEMLLRTKSGAVRTVLCGLESIDLDGVQCYLGSLVDITARKQAELELVRSTERLEILAEASRLFAEAGSEYNTVLSQVAHTLVTLMGDGCIIALISDDGAWLQASHVYDVDPDVQELTRSLAGGRHRIEDSTTNARVFQTGQPLLVPLVDRDQIRAAAKPEYVAMIERQAPHSLMVVPMRAFGRVISVLTLYRRQSERPSFNADDLRLAQDLGDRGALAIVNARLLTQVQAELAERKRAEAALRQSEQRFVTAFRANPATVIIVRRQDGMFVDANDTYKQVMGYSTEELIGHTAADLKIFVNPEVRAGMVRQLVEIGTANNFEAFMRTKSGAVRLFLLSAEPIEIDGDPCFLITGIDITIRKQVEDALRESEQRFRQLAESLPQMVWTCLASGPCDYLSRQWIEYTGILEAEQLGLGWLEQIHPDDRAPTKETWQAAVANSDAFRTEFRIRRYDGVYRWFDTRAVLIRDAEGRALKWVGTNTDIEERKHDQEELQRNAEQLQRLSHQLVEAQEAERRNIARELHDQVGQSLTGLKLVLDSTRMLAPENLDAQLAEARRAINELLGRVRNLSLDLRPSMLDDLGLLPALRWLIERYQAQTRITVHWWYTNIDRRFPALIETTVYRIVQEALTNVARYAKVPSVELRVMGYPDQLLVQIDDEGVGFDVQARLQSRQSVGLIGMRERIDLLGGSFLIESEPNEGTHLNIIIPLPIVPLLPERDAEE